MSELGNPFKKKQINTIWKKKQNQCQNAACEQKTASEKWKFDSNKKLDLEWTINGLGKRFKKFNRKNRINGKNQNEIAACEQKNNSEKANFGSNIVFSLYFKLRAKNNSLRKTTCFSAPLPVSAWPKYLLPLDFNNQENVWTNL